MANKPYKVTQPMTPNPSGDSQTSITTKSNSHRCPLMASSAAPVGKPQTPPEVVTGYKIPDWEHYPAEFWDDLWDCHVTEWCPAGTSKQHQTLAPKITLRYNGADFVPSQILVTNDLASPSTNHSKNGKARRSRKPCKVMPPTMAGQEWLDVYHEKRKRQEKEKALKELKEKYVGSCLDESDESGSDASDTSNTFSTFEELLGIKLSPHEIRILSAQRMNAQQLNIPELPHQLAIDEEPFSVFRENDRCQSPEFLKKIKAFPPYLSTPELGDEAEQEEDDEEDNDSIATNPWEENPDWPVERGAPFYQEMMDLHRTVCLDLWIDPAKRETSTSALQNFFDHQRHARISAQRRLQKIDKQDYSADESRFQNRIAGQQYGAPNRPPPVLVEQRLAVISSSKPARRLRQVPSRLSRIIKTKDNDKYSKCQRSTRQFSVKPVLPISPAPKPNLGKAQSREFVKPITRNTRASTTSSQSPPNGPQVSGRQPQTEQPLPRSLRPSATRRGHRGRRSGISTKQNTEASKVFTPRTTPKGPRTGGGKASYPAPALPLNPPPQRPGPRDSSQRRPPPANAPSGSRPLKTNNVNETGTSRISNGTGTHLGGR